jgi:hypothetical protein
VIPFSMNMRWATVSEEFLASRGSRSRSAGIGVKEVRKSARTLPHGSGVIDLGRGPGFPIPAVLVEAGLHALGPVAGFCQRTC